ncbi:MAG: site-2 protease family protein [Nitrospirae bacterium]|nr:site-2 protease family protein [Nitrospirota bacterium]
MEFAQVVQKIALVAMPLLFAITLHEAAHGWMADRKGDPTARLLGRVTFNPLPHIDPFGTVILPLMMMALGTPFLFGWAKPVPVNFSALRRPRLDMAWVAAAGPGANLFLALVSGGLFHLGLGLHPEFAQEVYRGMFELPEMAGAGAGFWIPLLFMLKISVIFNLLLMLFNLIPLPPLDGGRIAVGLLPRALAMPLARVEPFGMFILLALVLWDPIGLMRGVLWPALTGLAYLILG